ncbi:MAG: ABC transporter permease subunit [Acidobacteriaceae bacterium]|nr:ABC transporter permease subunit [Acidobacteriaceae bacterium]
MFTAIAGYYFKRQVYSRRLHVLAAAALCTMVLNAIAATSYIQQENRTFQTIARQAQAENTIERVFVPRPVNSFVFVDHGTPQHLPPYLIVTPWAMDVPIETFGASRNSYFMSLDFRSIFLLVFLMASLLISYDSVSGERDANRLRMLLCQPLSPVRLVLAAAVVCALILLAIVGLSLSLNLLLVTASGAIRFSPELIGRYAWAFAFIGSGSLIGVAVGCMLSSLCKSTWKSLIGVLAFWIAFVLVLPIATALSAAIANPPPSIYELETKIRRAQMMLYERVGSISSTQITDILNQNLSPRDANEKILSLESAEVANNLRELEKFKKEVTQYRADFLKQAEAADRLRKNLNLLSPFETAIRGLDASFTTGDSFEEEFEDAVARYVTAFSPSSQRLQQQWFQGALQFGPSIRESGYTIRQVLWVDYRAVPKPILAQLPQFSFQIGAADTPQAAFLLLVVCSHLAVCLLLLVAAARGVRVE